METTYKDMEIRCKKYTAKHILLENCYESNLLPDIACVDYLEGNKGRTKLEELEGLPLFVDDLYVFGYVGEIDIVRKRGRVLLSTGPTGSAGKIVRNLHSAAKNIFDSFVPTTIVHSIGYEKEGGRVRSTIQRIERDTDYKTRDIWKKHTSMEPAAVFVAKLDVSVLDVDFLLEKLQEFEKEIQIRGYGIYCIDYTKDFAGTLDRHTLVD